MMKKIKLSIPQRALFVEILERPKYVASYYSSSECLVKYGLATWLVHSWLTSTDAGRRYVEMETK